MDKDEMSIEEYLNSSCVIEIMYHVLRREKKLSHREAVRRLKAWVDTVTGIALLDYK